MPGVWVCGGAGGGIQELMRVLCDKLEEKMKGTAVDGTIKKLFEGQA